MPGRAGPRPRSPPPPLCPQCRVRPSPAAPVRAPPPGILPRDPNLLHEATEARNEHVLLRVLQSLVLQHEPRPP